MGLDDLLISYKQVVTPEPVAQPIIETLDDKFKKFQEWKNNNKPEEPMPEEEPEVNTDKYGFRGFNYTPTEKKEHTQVQATPVNENDNISRTYNYFANKGLSKVQITGIIGNLLSESGLNPQAVNDAERKAGLKGYGRGIAQWSNERVTAFTQHMGKSPENASLEEQLDYVWHEMQQRPALLQALQSAKTSTEAVDAVYRGYENGSANALTSVDQMTKTYSKAWKRLSGYKGYNFQHELSKRTKQAEQALKGI